MISLKRKATTPTGSIWTFHNTIRVVPANIHLNDPKAKGWWLDSDRASNQATLEFFANEDRSFDTAKKYALPPQFHSDLSAPELGQ